MLQLCAEERAMLSGELGPGVRKAMEIVVALGQIYGARRLVDVGSVQVAGVSDGGCRLQNNAASNQVTCVIGRS